MRRFNIPLGKDSHQNIGQNRPDYLHTLIRRREFLLGRITKGRHLSWDISEAEAIRWTISLLDGGKPIITKGKIARTIKMLQKRSDHLGARLASNMDRNYQFDKMEMEALLWAIEEIKQETIAQERAGK